MEAGVWRSRRWAAAFVRALVIVGPAIAGFLVAWGLAGALPRPDGLGSTLGWLALLMAVTLAVVLVAQRVFRRLLPLSWLLTLTLAFPERVPSRIQVARRAASRGERARLVKGAQTGSLGNSAGAAPEAALVLVAALSTHDRRTRGHSERVRMLADVLAEELGIEIGDRGRLRWGALLHDIGKLSVPGEILNKAGRPDESEWATLQRHPVEGKRLVEPLLGWLGPWAGAVGDHHEKWDGSGYPRGVAGEEISLGGRILAVADAYEVMTAARAYKKPASPAAARKELVAGAGSHFDPAVVRAFLGISLGKLWWIAGASAALAQLPVLSRLWTAPAGSRVKEAGSGAAVAASALAVVSLTGIASPGDDTPIGDRRQIPVAAPAPTAAGPAPLTPAAEAAPAEDGADTVPVDTSAVTPSTTVLPPKVLPGTPPGPAPVPPVPGRAGLPTPPPPSSEPPGTDAAPDAGPSSEPRRQLFAATGRSLLPAVIPGVGITELGFSLLCTQPALIGGVDGSVFELPEAARREPSSLSLVGDGVVAEVAFYSSGCKPLGRTETTSAGPELPVPPPARYVVVSPRSGAGEFGILVHARN